MKFGFFAPFFSLGLSEHNCKRQRNSSTYNR